MDISSALLTAANIETAIDQIDWDALDRAQLVLAAAAQNQLQIETAITQVSANFGKLMALAVAMTSRPPELHVWERLPEVSVPYDERDLDPEPSNERTIIRPELRRRPGFAPFGE